MGGFHIARNVTVPTLIPVLPDPAKATGAAVLNAPGGAYMALAMDNEGLLVARALADRGVAAFVLKYRLDPTTARHPPALAKPWATAWAPASRPVPKASCSIRPSPSTTPPPALQSIRSHPTEYKIDPTRTGMIGFSGRRPNCPRHDAAESARRSARFRSHPLWTHGRR